MKHDEEPQEEQERELPGWAYKVPFFLSKYGTHMLFAVALILLAYRGYLWYQTKQATLLNDAWSQLADANSPQASDPPGKLNNIITTYDIKPIQALAYVSLGDFYGETILLGNPADGVRGVKLTKEAAAQNAEKAYQTVLSDFNDQPLAVARARLGLGKIYEDQGQWDKAREQYEKLASGDTKSGFAGLAKSRLDHIDIWKQPIVMGPSLRPLEAATSASAPATGPTTTTTPPAAAPLPTTQQTH